MVNRVTNSYRKPVMDANSSAVDVFPVPTRNYNKIIWREKVAKGGKHVKGDMNALFCTRRSSHENVGATPCRTVWAC